MTFSLENKKAGLLGCKVFFLLFLLVGAVTQTAAYPTLEAEPASVRAQEAIAQEPGSSPVAEPALLAMQEALKSFGKTAADKLDSQDYEGVIAFYRQNGYRLIWLEKGRFTGKARSLIFKISRAHEYGLNPADYDLPPLGKGQGKNLPMEEMIGAELQMSLALVRYVRHLASGRLAPQSISESLDLYPERPDPAAILTDLLKAESPIDALAHYHPQHPQYKALLEQLTNLRMQPQAQKPIIIAEGKLLRPGMEDPRVPLLRTRLKAVPPKPESESNTGQAIPGEAEERNAAADTTYDETLVAAIKDFQRQSGLARDGVLGPRTLRALNADINSNPLQQVLVNLERWRWMPKDLGDFHVFVNIPEFRAFVKQHQEVVHSTRVIVGKAANKTVSFSDEMEKFVINPAWGVPKSIISNEMLPAARANPSYFSQKGYQVYARIRGRTRRIDPSRVDWRSVRASQISVRQPPGRGNALGHIKFLFPNKHAIYMHDTPAKSLFNRDVRAFSHGCVRVQNPLDFADAILAYEPEWNSQRIQKMIGGRENTVELTRNFPVHIAYFTTIVDDAGELIFHHDIYGHDKQMILALGL